MLANSIFSQAGIQPSNTYYYTPRENLFNSMKKKLTEPLEPKFFVLTEPDERVQEYVFNNKM